MALAVCCAAAVTDGFATAVAVLPAEAVACAAAVAVPFSCAAAVLASPAYAVPTPAIAVAYETGVAVTEATAARAVCTPDDTVGQFTPAGALASAMPTVNGELPGRAELAVNTPENPTTSAAASTTRGTTFFIFPYTLSLSWTFPCPSQTWPTRHIARISPLIA